MKVVTEDTPPSKRAVISLSQEPDGVSVKCEGYYLVKFNDNGTLTRYRGIPSRLGFTLDAGGGLVFQNE